MHTSPLTAEQSKHLIADLLEAMREAVEKLEHDYSHDDDGWAVAQDLRAAIAKAEPRS